jgi:anti-anti-sigma factor
MEIEVKENDEVITITIAGDIDLYTSKNFRNTVFEISQSRDKNIEIDFSGVDYMDSAGIGVLISLYKIQNAKGKKLIISQANADIINFIELSSLSYILEA